MTNKEYLQAYKLLNDKTDHELAEMLGVTYPAIRFWFTDKRSTPNWVKTIINLLLLGKITEDDLKDII